MKLKYNSPASQYLTTGKIYYGQFVNGQPGIGGHPNFMVIFWNDAHSWATSSDLNYFEPIE